jgi:hypothetical protein
MGRRPCTVIENDVVCGKPSVCDSRCSTHDARFKRNGTVLMGPPREHPGWGKGSPGHGRWWTKRRTLAALKAYAKVRPDNCPSSDHEWSAIKKGIYELPPAQKVLEYFGTMARAWLAAGVPRDRVKMLATRWSEEEKKYLLERAGIDTLEAIARKLNRSYGSVKSMIGAKGMKITARANQGLWSANQLSHHYGCSYKRVLDALNAGTIPGHRHRQRQTWLVDPADLTPAIEAFLREPPKTHLDNVSVGIPPRDRKLGTYVPAHLQRAIDAAPVIRTTVLASGKVLTVKKLWA